MTIPDALQLLNLAEQRIKEAHTQATPETKPIWQQALLILQEAADDCGITP